MAPAAGVLPEVQGPVFEVDDLTYSIERRDGRVFHRETRRDADGQEVEHTEAEVLYALGSGERGVSFLVQRGTGLFQSPIAWYSQERRWDLAPGYRIQNLHFGRPITLECLFCHTNQVTWRDDRPPSFEGLTIGCERCHGPGALHARDPRAINGQDLTIVNPARLEPPAIREAVCEQCHLQGTDRTVLLGRSPYDFRPGLALEDVMRIYLANPDPAAGRRAVGHVEQMRESRCYRRSDGQLGCLSCHDPHDRPEPAERIAYYRDRCLTCHADQGCPLPKADRLAKSPENDCIECHMPRSAAGDIGHTALTNHTIPRRPPAVGEDRSNR